MYSLIKKAIPGFLKSFFWQPYLRIKFSSNNKLGKKITFSKDLVMKKNCQIGNGVTFGISVALGNNVKIGSKAILEKIQIDDFTSIDNIICTGYGNGQIKVGKQCYIGINNILDWSNNITIGDFVHIAGPSTGLFTHTSAPMCLNGIPLAQKEETYRPTAPIVIESNVYVGGNCTIYPGITIGHHSVVAPNSAVTKDVNPYTMVGGVPARKIKELHIDNDK